MGTNITSKKDWLSLKPASKTSHKGENGRLLIFAGSPLYHGALILAINAAVRFCDLIYVFTSEQNVPLLNGLKEQSPNIIVLTPRSIQPFFSKIDAYLVGPGWEENEQNKSLLSKLLKTKNPIVIDATALKLLDLSLLHKNALLTPHAGEFESLFKLSANAENAKAMAKKYKCTILLKGPTDYIASPLRLKANTTHDVGMTKGGTGDVLAGLCAAIFSTQKSAYKSACAAAFLNGYAGTLLAKRMGPNYSSQDLANELAVAAHELSKK
ncbi:MAG: NAD(P)H-hydrate dehydratase [Candidatus Micrarchaeia archaeon]